MTQPFEDSTLTLPDLHIHKYKSSIACATRLISTDIDFVCPGSTMPGGGWMQVFDMSHLLHAFNAWASGVYCAKQPAHCENILLLLKQEVSTKLGSSANGGGK